MGTIHNSNLLILVLLVILAGSSLVYWLQHWFNKFKYQFMGPWKNVTEVQIYFCASSKVT